MDEPLPLPDLPAPAPSQDEQLSLIGSPQPVRIPAALWESWLSDSNVTTRFETKRYRRSPDKCWPWLAAVSSTGHGSFRAGSLPGRTRRGTVPAHLFAYQLANGVLPRLGWTGADDPVLCHQCDFAGCTNPAHLRVGTNATNRAEYHSRRLDPGSPLADLRGPAGRTRAIANAVRLGLSNGEPPGTIEQRIYEAEQAGRPFTLW